MFYYLIRRLWNSKPFTWSHMSMRWQRISAVTSSKCLPCEKSWLPPKWISIRMVYACFYHVRTMKYSKHFNARHRLKWQSIPVVLHGKTCRWLDTRYPLSPHLSGDKVTQSWLPPARLVKYADTLKSFMFWFISVTFSLSAIISSNWLLCEQYC